MKTRRTCAKVRATMSRRNFSQRTHPIQLIGPQTDILVHFVLFGYIWDHLVALQNSMKTGRTSAIVRARKSRQNFSQRTHSIHPIGPQTDVLYYLGAFWTVWLPYGTQCQTGQTSAKFVKRSHVGIFRNERTRSLPLDPKLTFWCIFYYLGAFGTV